MHSENDLGLMKVLASDKRTAFMSAVYLVPDNLGLKNRAEPLEVVHCFVLVPAFGNLAHKKPNVYLRSLKTSLSKHLNVSLTSRKILTVFSFRASSEFSSLRTASS